MKAALGIVVAIGLVGCESAKKKPAEGQAKIQPDDVAKPEVAKPEVKSETTAEPPLPAELEALAEMPELPAEATPAMVKKRVDRYIDALSAFFEVIVEHEDCDKMGKSLSRFADVHERFLERLNEVGKNPEVGKQMSAMLMSRGSKYLTKLGDNLSRCAQHPSMLTALMKLSRTQKAK